MIPRYSRTKLEKIWSIENKYKIWTEIECLVAEKLAINKTIPKKAAQDIRKKAKFNTKEIEIIERQTKHDFIAYINNVSKYIGKNSKYFHYGLTSSDVIDTSFSIQLSQAAEIIIDDLKNLLKIIKQKSIKYKKTVMIGRSHGIHAEPITFGIKMASYYCEFERNLERLKNAKKEISVCAISGAVGTYSTIDPSIEKYVANKMGLGIEKISTQIIPRDRHAMFFSTLAIIASSIERLATEIRNLQKTDVLEVEEYFSIKQKGSSAMPHKRNPILSENLTGISRYIRGAIIPFLENIVLWHERDISHSSVERILAPDITTAIDFSIDRLSKIIKNLIIYPKNMKKNINKIKGLENSQNVLLSLIKKGLSRQDAYDLVQNIAMQCWNKNQEFEFNILKNKTINKYLTKIELKNIFNNKRNIDNSDRILKKAFKK